MWLKQRPTKMRWNVLLVRAIIGLLCGILLVRLFLPKAGFAAVFAAALLLVFFAYVFEAVRRR